jgi:hypothetical protein
MCANRTTEDMAMSRDPISDENKLSSPMTTRWTCTEYALVSDEAWRRRQSASSLVRELVMAALSPNEGTEVTVVTANSANPTGV